MNLRSRIVELRRVRASELQGNAENWRRHPEAQRGALSAMLREVGFVGAVIARKLKSGKLEIIDGHLRADIAEDAEIPVLVTDLDETEAKKILATYDPLSAAAEADGAALARLLSSVALPDHADLRKLVADLDFANARAERKKLRAQLEHEVAGMPLRPHEHYDYIVVLASSTHDWNVLCEVLGLQQRKRRGFNSIGVCRAIRAERLLELIPREKTKKRRASR